MEIVGQRTIGFIFQGETFHSPYQAWGQDIIDTSALAFEAHALEEGGITIHSMGDDGSLRLVVVADPDFISSPLFLVSHRHR